MPNTPMGYHRRNSLRHKSFDYTSAAAYFVTICADRGRCVFGQIINSMMILNPLGQIADQAWARIVKNHPNVHLDAHIVMPDHGHAVLWLRIDPDQPAPAAPAKTRRFGDAIAGSLSTLINSYKSSVTQQAQHKGLVLDGSFWQSNFYDHIVRSGQELQRIRDYIEANPARWLEDQLHPKAPPNQFNRTWNREGA